MIHSLFASLLSASSLLAIVGVLAATVGLVLKRWAFALKLGTVITIGSVLLIAVVVAQFAVVLVAPGVLPILANDPSQRARVVAEAGSIALNCTAFYMLVVIAAAPIRSFSARRLRESG